ncbi:MAG TPA: translation elongation factor Ts [Anaerolineae bacterium]|nr:translation elongation factor Ts [Anaerolineae bacterium]
MEITATMVKELREQTGAGILDCKLALQEADGDLEKATQLLRKKGLARAAKKVGRAAHEGLIEAYIHAGGRVGALVELNCETDFVARTDAFKELAHDLAMQVVATNPRYLDEDDIPTEVLEGQRESFRAEAAGDGKPDHVVERIVEGKMAKYLDEVCLLRQPFIKDEGLTVRDLITEKIAQLGENIVVRRFARFELGGEDGASD